MTAPDELLVLDHDALSPVLRSRWFSPQGFDYVLVCRVADDLAELPGSPLAGLGIEARERAVKRVLALVEERGYAVVRKEPER